MREPKHFIFWLGTPYTCSTESIFVVMLGMWTTIWVAAYLWRPAEDDVDMLGRKGEQIRPSNEHHKILMRSRRHIALSVGLFSKSDFFRFKIHFAIVMWFGSRKSYVIFLITTTVLKSDQQTNVILNLNAKSGLKILPVLTREHYTSLLHCLILARWD
jgi:hypothetical protein